MTKQQIKDLCEDDDKLQWWAMVLFAEMCDLYHHAEELDETCIKILKHKMDEFPKLVVYRQLEKIKESREVKNEN